MLFGPGGWNDNNKKPKMDKEIPAHYSLRRQFKVEMKWKI